MRWTPLSIICRETMNKTPSSAHIALMDIYRRLFLCYGPQRWWPARTRFEMIVGAILTQNTAWKNVEKAIRNLRSDNLLSPEKIRRAPRSRIARAVRPSGYYNLKTVRLKNIVRFLYAEYRGKLSHMFSEPTDSLRERLLSVSGLGKETVDSIVLYAGKRPVFVVDAYTKRIVVRHGLIAPGASYDEMQELFMRNLPRDHAFFNEYHALIVMAGKTVCRSRPRCGECPLADLLPADSAFRASKARGSIKCRN